MLPPRSLLRQASGSVDTGASVRFACRIHRRNFAKGTSRHQLERKVPAQGKDALFGTDFMAREASEAGTKVA